jgi:hypothetical protein
MLALTGAAATRLDMFWQAPYADQMSPCKARLRTHCICALILALLGSEGDPQSSMSARTLTYLLLQGRADHKLLTPSLHSLIGNVGRVQDPEMLRQHN